MSENEFAEIAPQKGPNPQKVKWTNIAYYSNYQEANVHRNQLDGLTKVRRCGTNGSKFVVKTGKKINKGDTDG